MSSGRSDDFLLIRDLCLPQCWPAVHRRTSKATDPAARRAAYVALLHNIIRIARKPNVRGFTWLWHGGLLTLVSFVGARQDDEVDEEEWLRVREQVVSEVLSIVYLEVRSELLQIIVDEFSRVLATTDFDEACRGVEGCVFCVRTVSFYLVKRASLAGGVSPVLATSDRACPSHRHCCAC